MKNACNFVGRKGLTILFAVALWMINISLNAEPWSAFRGNNGHDGVWNGYIVPENMTMQWVLNPQTNSEFANVTLWNLSTPCVSSDGGILFVYGNLSTGNEGKIFALNAFDDGANKILWTKDVYSHVSFYSASSPVYSTGYLYWIGSDGTNIRVYKINAITGKETDGGWITPEIPGNVVNCSPLIADGKVFFSTYADWEAFNSIHYALKDADGSVVWKNETAGGYGTGTMAYEPSTNLVFQTTYVGKKQNISAFDPNTGEVKKTSSFEVANSFFPNGMALKNGYLYVQDYDFQNNITKIYKVRTSDLSLVWSADMPAGGDGTPCVDDNGNVYASCDWKGNGQTRAFDKNGNILWTFEKAGGWFNSPAFARDLSDNGYIFVGSQNSNSMYMLEAKTGKEISVFYGSGAVTFSNKYIYTVTTDNKVASIGTGILYGSSGTAIVLNKASKDGKKPKISIAKGEIISKANVSFYNENTTICSFKKLKNFTADWHNIQIDSTTEKIMLLSPAVTSLNFQYQNKYFTVQGYNFGASKPNIYLQPNGAGKKKKCSIKQYYQNISTGAGKIQCKIGKIDKGIYDVIVESDIGSSTIHSISFP